LEFVVRRDRANLESLFEVEVLEARTAASEVGATL
jgi:hypothetical protein